MPKKLIRRPSVMAVSNSLPLMLPGHPLYFFPHDYYGGVMYMSVAGSSSVLQVPADTIQQGTFGQGPSD